MFTIFSIEKKPSEYRHHPSREGKNLGEENHYPIMASI